MTNHSSDEQLRSTLRRALKEIERLREKIAASEHVQVEPVAVVGVGLRLPGGVVDLASLWTLLDNGVDAVTPFPDDRWDVEATFDPDPELAGKSYVRHAAFVDDIDWFDSAFFNISPREAKHIDPQHRLLLETAYEALERASIPTESLVDSQTGVFVGIGPSDYGSSISSNDADAYSLLGTLVSFAAGRVAFSLGLQGPAMSIDTACSSSLVALHLATKSLQAGECSLALAGGVQVLAGPQNFIRLSRTRALAPDGRSKTFSSLADGYGRGEGVVMLALERLCDARRNNHKVLGLVRGTAVNHDGRSSGITAPNGSSQRKVLRAALDDAGLAPRDIDLVECHGTGTSLGDPIEVGALAAVYGHERPADQPLYLGAFKTNIGHLESAAGLAGVVKVLAALEHEILPLSLHTQPLNPHIDWATLPVRVLDAPVPWPMRRDPRRAGVSGFGLSGTNAHVIIEEAPSCESGPVKVLLAPPRHIPVVISGRAMGAVADRAKQMIGVEELVECRTIDIAASLATGRSHFELRVALVASSNESLNEELQAIVDGRSAPRRAEAAPNLALLFTGQGSQRLAMGRELAAAYPGFGDSLDEIFAQFDLHLETPLRDVVFADAGSELAKLLDQTAYSQAALFALEVALYRLFAGWGVEPDLLLGHSIGELVAAHVASVLSLADACTLVAARGRLMQALPAGGTMLSIQASEAEVLPTLEGLAGVDIAGLNGPLSTVVSGDEEPIATLEAHFKGLGRKTRRLVVSHAFHSYRMDPMLDDFRKVAESLRFSPPEIPIVSNVTGKLATADELTSPDYWVLQVRSAVRFFDCVRVLEQQDVRACLELGPHGVLCSMAAACLSDAGQEKIALLPALRRDRPETETLALALGGFHCQGGTVDWQAYFAPFNPKRVELPTYPFQRQRYWLDKPETSPVLVADSAHEFWAAVNTDDGETLTRLLDLVEPDGRKALERLLPALASWHRRHLKRYTTAAWRYAIDWRPVSKREWSSAPRTWLIVSCSSLADAKLPRALVQILEKFDVQLDVVTFEPSSSRAQTTQLLTDALRASAPELVLSLLGLDDTRHPEHPSLPVGLALNLALSQALNDSSSNALLWMFTQGAVSIGDGDALRNPLQAMNWGLGQTLALEHPERWGGLLDLPSEYENELLAQVPIALLRGDSEDQLALRDGGLFGRRLIRAATPRISLGSFRPRGTVLITGGTGALGIHVARWLAGEGAEHLVLTSRRGPDAPGARELQAELEGLVSKVSIVACDVSSFESVSSLFDRLRDQGDRLTTIIHAAGTLDDGVVSTMTPERLAHVAAAKVGAALVLHECSRSLELDHFVLFSSIAGNIGNRGQSNYAAANAFLDALALHRAGQGLPAISIGWGPWGDGGMATSGAAAQRTRRQGFRPLDPECATAALAVALEIGEPNTTIIDVDWSTFAPSYIAGRARALFADIPEATTSQETDEEAKPTSLLDDLRHLSNEERGQRVLDLVLQFTASVLGVSDVSSLSPHTGFADLGFDSLMAVEFRQRLQRGSGQRLPATLTFDFPSPIRVRDTLLARIGESLGESSAEEMSDQDLRVALANVSLSRLRRSGLLQSLLEMREDERHAKTIATDTTRELDELDSDDLVDAVSHLLGSI